MTKRHVVLTSPTHVMGIGLDEKNHAAVLPERLSFMKGWTLARIEEYAESKAWKHEVTEGDDK